jgi:hypothetical protein
MDLGEDLISLVCLVLNVIALVRCGKSDNLDAMNGGWLGVIYTPNHQTSRLVKAAVAWRTGQSGAPATSPNRWIPTVGAFVFWATRQSGGAPDRLSLVSDAPSGSALTLARTVAHLMPSADDRWREVAIALLAHRTVRCATGHCPVLHRTVR